MSGQLTPVFGNGGRKIGAFEHSSSRHGDGGVTKGQCGADIFAGPFKCARAYSGANMPSLSFAAPTSVDEAVKILAGAPGMAKVLAGGTDLLVQLRSGRVKP